MFEEIYKESCTILFSQLKIYIFYLSRFPCSFPRQKYGLIKTHKPIKIYKDIFGTISDILLFFNISILFIFSVFK